MIKALQHYQAVLPWCSYLVTEASGEPLIYSSGALQWPLLVLQPTQHPYPQHYLHVEHEVFVHFRAC
jgi:hypothetical protein